MHPVKLKFATSTFLLIFFYFPKTTNGYIDSDTCDARDSCIRYDKVNRKIFFEPQFMERETRMVNVRNRVGSEKLVNNRRIVDSDSRISDDIQSQNFDFPRLIKNSRDLSHRERTNRISQARFTPSLIRSEFERDTQTRRGFQIRVSHNRDSRSRVETGRTRVLDREARSERRDFNARESRFRQSREMRLPVDNVFERLSNRVSSNKRINANDRESRLRELGEMRLPVDNAFVRLSNRVGSHERRNVDAREFITNPASRIVDNRSRNRANNNSQRRLTRNVRDRNDESRVVRISREVNRRMLAKDIRQQDQQAITYRKQERNIVERESPERTRERRVRSSRSDLRRIVDSDSRMRSIDSFENARVERRSVERASPDVNRRLADLRERQIQSHRDEQRRIVDSKVRTPQNVRLTERQERRYLDRSSRRATNLHQQERRTTVTRESNMRTEGTVLVRRNYEQVSRTARGISRERKVTDPNDLRVRDTRLHETRHTIAKSTELRQSKDRVTGNHYDRRHEERMADATKLHRANNDRRVDSQTRSNRLMAERVPVRVNPEVRTRAARNLRERSEQRSDRFVTARKLRNKRTETIEVREAPISRIRNTERNIRENSEQERQNGIRITRENERRISENRQKSGRAVDINNNNRVQERQVREDKSRESPSGNNRSTISMHTHENHISKWSNLFATTCCIVLLTQIITSSNAKKYGIPQVTSFLHGFKEKVY